MVSWTAFGDRAPADLGAALHLWWRPGLIPAESRSADALPRGLWLRQRKQAGCCQLLFCPFLRGLGQPRRAMAWSPTLSKPDIPMCRRVLSPRH